MVHLALPFTDAELYLAPRWGVGAVLVALAALALVIWLYRYELRLISRRVAFGLLTLRLIVVLLLLFVVAVSPLENSTSDHNSAALLPSSLWIFGLDGSLETEGL